MPARAEARALPERYVLVGVGGVGSWLLRMLTPYVHSLGRPATLVVVDGDAFEERDRSRALFTRPGSKPAVLIEELAAHYGDRITFLPVPRYVSSRNAFRVIDEGDVVFSQPDNHATRRVVERRCARLDDVALFSGGNDGVENGSSGTFGNVQIYLRESGENRTNPISTFHPEIAKPADRSPAEAGCTAASASAPQIIVTNVEVASSMLGAFYAWLHGQLRYEEAYLDIASGARVPVERELVRRRGRKR